VTVQVSCPSCKKMFGLDDSKAPKKPVTMKCPSCGGAIPVMPPASAAQSAPQEAAAQATVPPAPAVPGAEVPEPARPWSHGGPEWERMKQEVTREVLRNLGVQVSESEGGEEGEEDGRLRALVCDDEEMFRTAICAALTQFGYKVETAPSVAAALEQIQKGTYDVVTVDNRFPDDPEGGYQILQAINALPSDVRRKMFVAFISADLATLDLQSAFALGANLTIAKRDVRRLEKIMNDGIKEHDKLYRVFYKVQEEIQKEEA
jgi:CheY-like chemotaxis protein